MASIPANAPLKPIHGYRVGCNGSPGWSRTSVLSSGDLRSVLLSYGTTLRRPHPTPLPALLTIAASVTMLCHLCDGFAVHDDMRRRHSCPTRKQAFDAFRNTIHATSFLVLARGVEPRSAL